MATNSTQLHQEVDSILPPFVQGLSCDGSDRKDVAEQMYDFYILVSKGSATSHTPTTV